VTLFDWEGNRRPGRPESNGSLPVHRDQRRNEYGTTLFFYLKARPNYGFNGSNDADSRKDVLLMSLVDSATHLGSQIIKKLGRE